MARACAKVVTFRNIFGMNPEPLKIQTNPRNLLFKRILRVAGLDTLFDIRPLIPEQAFALNRQTGSIDQGSQLILVRATLADRLTVGTASTSPVSVGEKSPHLSAFQKRR